MGLTWQKGLKRTEENNQCNKVWLIMWGYVGAISAVNLGGGGFKIAFRIGIVIFQEFV